MTLVKMVDVSKRFPVQRLGTIPWELGERAYAAYTALYGNRQSIERMAQRAGFAPEEIDCLLAGCDPFEWRRHTTEEKAALREAWVSEVAS